MRMRIFDVGERKEFLKSPLPVAGDAASVGVAVPEIVPLGHWHNIVECVEHRLGERTVHRYLRLLSVEKQLAVRNPKTQVPVYCPLPQSVLDALDDVVPVTE